MSEIRVLLEDVPKVSRLLEIEKHCKSCTRDPIRYPSTGASNAKRTFKCSWRASQFANTPSRQMPTNLSSLLACRRATATCLGWKLRQFDFIKAAFTKDCREASLSMTTSRFRPPTPISFMTLTTLRTSFSRSPDITTIPSMPVANITRMSTFQYFPLPKKRKSAPRPSGSASFRIRRAGVLPLAWTQAPQPAS